MAATPARRWLSFVDQTILADDPARQGNCLAACVATFLGIPLHQVPHFAEYPAGEFCEGDAWWHLLIGFMAGHGLAAVELDDPSDADPDEIVFVCGPSPRGVKPTRCSTAPEYSSTTPTQSQ